MQDGGGERGGDCGYGGGGGVDRPEPMGHEQKKEEDDEETKLETRGLAENPEQGGTKEDVAAQTVGTLAVAGHVQVEEEFVFKVLLIGDAGVGKTSFVERYTSGVFKRDYRYHRGSSYSYPQQKY